MLPRDWESPPKNLQLENDEVHVWRSNLDSTELRIDLLKGTLSRDELFRADRFHSVEHQIRFIAAHGILRHILSCYLLIPPQQISFRYNRYGKPILEHSDQDFDFNAAHSENAALFAIAKRPVGIDVEKVRFGFDYLSIAHRFFASNETDALLSYSEGQRAEAFFRCWTRKESFIKAQGKGMSFLLHEFIVSLETEEQTKIISNAHAETWMAFHLSPYPGYIGALATVGTPGLRFWNWT